VRSGVELLEREAALADLARWHAEAGSGMGRLVLVSGEAGIGKTSLLRAFARDDGRSASSRAAGRRRVLWGACDPLTTPRPFGPLVDLAPALGGLVAQRLAEQTAAAGELAGTAGQPARDPAHSSLFVEVFDALTGGGGSRVLVIEDLHWADAATLDLLRFLARRVASTRVLVVASYRHDEVGSADGLRLLLGDLANVAAVRRLRLSTMGFLQYVGPTLQFVMATFVFHEPLNHNKLVSFIICWIGIALYVTEGIIRSTLKKSG